MLQFIRDLLSKTSKKENVVQSSQIAKERLQLIIVHDRASMTPEMFSRMKDELIDVIARYLEVDKSTFDITLNQDEREVALVANIPITKAKEIPNVQTIALNA